MEKFDVHDPIVLMEVLKVLQNGGVVMHPTETCYGLAVDVFSREALEKLYKLKGREAHKPLSILVNGMGMATEYGVFSAKAQELAEKYWPGPLSIVVPRKDNLPTFLNKGERFISMRFSSEEFCDEFVKAFHRPVTTTSANASGEPPLYEPEIAGFGENAALIDLVVDAGKIPENKPSTVVKVDGDKVEVLRQGDLKIL